MDGLTERVAARALIGLGHQEQEDLGRIAHRLATLLLATVRLTALPVGAVLMLEGGATGINVLLTAVLCVAWVVASSRRAPARGRRTWHSAWLLAGDIVALTAGMALSGGIESPVRLLTVPLPIAAGLVLAPRAVVASGLGLLVGYATLGELGRPLASLAIQVAWATAVGAGVASQRERGLRRLDAVDDVRRAVLAGDGAQERSRLGRELRDAALAPLEAVQARIDAASRAELRELTDAVADAARRLRSVVVELHVLTARQGGLRGSLEALAQRRSPTATVLVEAPAGLSDAEVVRVTGVAREALRAVAGPGTERVSVTISRPDRGGLRVEVDAEPARAEDADSAALAGAFSQRAILAGGGEATVDGGAARVVLEDVTAAAAPTWIPGRSLQDTRLLVFLTRVPSIAAAVASALVVGGAQPGFFVGAALMLLWSPVIVETSASADAGFARWALVTVPDVIGLAVMAATVGGALEWMLPLLVAIAPCYGLLLSPALTAGTNAVVATALVLAGLDSTRFLVAFGWSVGVALLLSVGVAALDQGLARLAQLRRELVGRLAARQDRERRELAERMHDETLQVLLATRQELEEAAQGAPGARTRAQTGIARALAELREVAGDLADPGLREPSTQDGPRAALEALAAATTARGGPRVVVDVAADAAGAHDGLVVRLARELVANVVTHAAAGRLELRLAREDGDLVLDVTDDGRGIDRDRLATAVARGHVGLASCSERAVAAGGSLVLEPADGGGTWVRVRLPLRPARRGAAA